MTKLWGGNYEAAPDAAFWEFNRSFPFDRRLLARGGRGLAGLGAGARPLRRRLRQPTPRRSTRGLGAGAREARGTTRAISSSTSRTCTASSRSGWARSSASSPARRISAAAATSRRSRRCASSCAARSTALRAALGDLVDRARRAGPRRRRRRDARLHAHARGRADHLRPLGGGPRLGPGARPRAAARRARARRRAAARLGRARGAALPLDREAMAHDLGFAAVSPSALDAVMDRDFAVEFVSCCAQLQTHLARLAEDLIRLRGTRVRLRAPARGLHHRLEPDAAEEEPRRARAGPRQGRRASTATCCACSRCSRACRPATRRTCRRTRRRSSTPPTRPWDPSPMMRGVVAGLVPAARGDAGRGAGARR